MDQDDLKYWIALKSIDGVGNIGFKNLVDAFDNPRNVFSAPLHTLTDVPGIGKKIGSNIKNFNDWQKAENEIKLIKKYYAHIVTYKDPVYPKVLLNVYDFPVFLYARGFLKENDVNVAVVGSRMASTYGRFSTERLCRELALKGITVVSGLARGIDSAAHKGALAGGGRTIAVLGCGLDTVYPAENEKLFKDIVSRGAVITEYPFGTPPNSQNFPARNRIISGISLGVVVVEANEKSGSLITARLAMEQGRDVFAVPGSIDSTGSRGTHKLIKEGAKLIENVYDILDEILPQVDMEHQKKLGISPIPNEKNGSVPDCSHKLNEREISVLQIISSKAVAIDDIVSQAGLKPNDVLNILLTLELRGIIKQLPGKMYMLKE